MLKYRTNAAVKHKVDDETEKPYDLELNDAWKQTHFWVFCGFQG